MDAFKSSHDELKCKMGCCHVQPNKVARKRLKAADKKEYAKVEVERDAPQAG